MPDRYTHRILRHVQDRRYQPSTLDQLTLDLQVPEDQVETFKQAADGLLEHGQLVLGTGDTVGLPPPGKYVTGVFRKHPRGFGFLIPDEVTSHGDLFVPGGRGGDAVSGDRVRARVMHDKRGGGGDAPSFIGQIVEVVERADRPVVGTLHRKGRRFWVQPDGRAMTDPIAIRDPHAKNAKPGDKVVVELTQYPSGDTDAEGVILEVLGEPGEPDVETAGVIRAHGLAERFEQDVLDDARDASRRMIGEDDPIPEDRQDFTGRLIVTIDPPDARDFDDAIEVERLAPGQSENGAVWRLGVHIADVAHFVRPGSALDQEAYARGNSTYLPRRVLPMLPEVLSNGVCSLQPGVRRFAKSVSIDYDAKGHVLSAKFARSVIHSARRFTYLEAQAVIDGDLREARKHCKDEPKYPRAVCQMLEDLDAMAKTIRKRRMAEGMIVLGLPDAELVFDDSGRVVDAQPEDDAFTHTLIEMCMVEANEAAARLFDGLEVPMIRRVHPDPDAYNLGDLRSFARVAGFNIPARPNRQELQSLLEAVRDKPAQHAVHLAVLKTLSKAEYAPTPVGHFALASEHYTHFTSPIRRYADLVVHRAIDATIAAESTVSPKKKGGKRKDTLRNLLADDPRVPDEDTLVQIGRHCSQTERASEAAERELRKFLLLELLSQHLGDDFDGTVTGVSGQGLFVQLDRFLVDGFVRLADLPGERDRWRLNRNTGALVAERSGMAITLGDRFTVRVANIDLPGREMELAVVGRPGGKKVRSGGQSDGGSRNGQASGQSQKNKNKGGKPAKPGKQNGPKKPVRGKKSKSGKKGNAGNRSAGASSSDGPGGKVAHEGKPAGGKKKRSGKKRGNQKPGPAPKRKRDQG
ncbi:MAG: VacB/RNase II family 3'-5' exoribonuclease [Planctomycetota bacterium]